MKPDVSDIIAVVRGYREGHAAFEKMRFDRIRNSDILVDGPILQDAFDSAKFLKGKKPISGLVALRSLLSKMHR